MVNRTADRVLVIADGAAFGSELEKIYRLMESQPNKITLYLPESFEWLVLKSGMLMAILVSVLAAYNKTEPQASATKSESAM